MDMTPGAAAARALLLELRRGAARASRQASRADVDDAASRAALRLLAAGGLGEARGPAYLRRCGRNALLDALLAARRRADVERLAPLGRAGAASDEAWLPRGWAAQDAASHARSVLRVARAQLARAPSVQLGLAADLLAALVDGDAGALPPADECPSRARARARGAAALAALAEGRPRRRRP
jgi:hypothetical protein